MKKTVRHGQIGQSINVHLTVIVCERSDIAVKPEVFLVVSTKSAPNGVIVVDDRGDCIESEPVDMIDIHKVQQLAQKELDDLPMTRLKRSQTSRLW